MDKKNIKKSNNDIKKENTIKALKLIVEICKELNS